MTGAEAKKLRDEEIKVELARLRNRLYDMRTQSVTDKVANTAEFRNVRRDIARLLTERRSRHAGKAGAAVKAASKTAGSKTTGSKTTGGKITGGKTTGGKSK